MYTKKFPVSSDSASSIVTSLSVGDTLQGFIRSELDMIEKYMRRKDAGLFLITYGESEPVASVLGRKLEMPRE